MLLKDMRYALRLMRRSPGFTAVAVLSLALGISANTAIYSLFYTIMLRQLPVAHPEQLVEFLRATPEEARTGFCANRRFRSGGLGPGKRARELFSGARAEARNRRPDRSGRHSSERRRRRGGGGGELVLLEHATASRPVGPRQAHLVPGCAQRPSSASRRARIAGIGLYGLLAYTVARRTNEIGFGWRSALRRAA